MTDSSVPLPRHERHLSDAQRCAHPRCPLHSGRHLLIAPQSLHAQRNSLQLHPHLRKLLDIPPCPHKIFGEDLARILSSTAVPGLDERTHHVARFGVLLDIRHGLLLLCLQLPFLPLQLPLSFLE